MKYLQKRIDATDCHIFTGHPSEGKFVANRSYGLQQVKDFSHGWYEVQMGMVPYAKINASYFNTSTGKVVGGMYVDSGFLVSDFLEDSKFVTMVIDAKGNMQLTEEHNINRIKDLYPDLSAAVQLGDPLVMDGQEYIGDGHFDHTWGDNPRTFVGQLYTGEYVFFATDGRTGSDKGFSAQDLRSIALEMGCRTAVMCDGGGSSTLMVEGNMVNDNENRKVPSVFMFYGKPNQDVEWETENGPGYRTHEEWLNSEICDGVYWKDLINGLGDIYLTPDIWDWLPVSKSYDWLLSQYMFPNFTYREIACQDDGQLKLNKNAYEHGIHMQELRDDMGFAIKIGSWIRTWRHNTAVDGAPRSRHPKCDASDINTRDRVNVSRMARWWKTKGYGGIGYYSWGLHCDSRGYLKEW